MQTYDFIILGAGIVGLSIAREIKYRHPSASIAIIEKEPEAGLHASGRNSGVLHSGIYYPSDTLKAKFCATGAKALRDYCQEYQLPCHKLGKVIVPTTAAEDALLEMLQKRALANGARAKLIDKQQLAELEPDVKAANDRALYCPDSSVIDAKQVLFHMLQQLQAAPGIELLFSSTINQVEAKRSLIQVNHRKIQYGSLVNATGLFADKIAHQFNAGQDYKLLPFKGVYYQLTENSPVRCNGLIYPVPDLNMPFLGIHFTRGIGGNVYIGPSSVPALGREHYHGLTGIRFNELFHILADLTKLYFRNQQGFRQFAHQEGMRFFKHKFIQSAKRMMPNISTEDVRSCHKVGIRPQLYNKQTGRLEMDFLIEKQDNTVHILNAISPAFTSCMPFAKHVVDGHF